MMATEVVVYANLSKGHRDAVVEGALLSKASLLDRTSSAAHSTTIETKPSFTWAAFSLVGESCVEPSKYYDNKLVAGLVLLDAMRSCGVKQIVFFQPQQPTASLRNNDP